MEPDYKECWKALKLHMLRRSYSSDVEMMRQLESKTTQELREYSAEIEKLIPREVEK